MIDTSKGTCDGCLRLRALVAVECANYCGRVVSVCAACWDDEVLCERCETERDYMDDAEYGAEVR